MGLGTGLGARARGRRARGRARHRQHRRQRRHHNRRNIHHGSLLGTRGPFGFHLGFGMLFQRQNRTPTGQNSAATPSTSPPTAGPTSRLPPWHCSVLVAIFFLIMVIIPFAVPAVPFPIGITFAVLFILIVLVPLVGNMNQTRLARRNAEADVEARSGAEGVPRVSGMTYDATAHEGSWIVGETPNAFGGMSYSGASWVDTNTAWVHTDGVYRNGWLTGGQTVPNFSDPPPTFAEATANTSTIPSDNALPSNASHAQGLVNSSQHSVITRHSSLNAREENTETWRPAEESPPPSYDEVVAVTHSESHIEPLP